MATPRPRQPAAQAEPRSAARLTGRLELSTDLGAFLGDTRVRLLEAIAEHGSISQAAKQKLMALDDVIAKAAAAIVEVSRFDIVRRC